MDVGGFVGMHQTAAGGKGHSQSMGEGTRWIPVCHAMLGRSTQPTS